ncbi:MAG TPA: response regulator transcription factor [Vicinamibacterales bacterium]|nr:response regulator transcription factor [Vicinamibacterales bacterium]
MINPIRVLLADDHESVRQGLCALFATSPGVSLVTDVKDGAEAVEMVRTTSPDVVIMDLSMPTSGLVAMREIKAMRSETAVVVLSRHRDAAYVRAAFAAGATGYVLKQSPFSELKKAVLAAARGERYVDDQLGRDPAAKRSEFDTAVSQLSPRETEVLRRAAAGNSNKEIANELQISVKTVEAHKANAMRKLDLKDRSAIVRFAIVEGWLQD